MQDEMSHSEIMKNITKMYVEIQTVEKSIEKKIDEYNKKKISINRLEIQLQKQKSCNKKLLNEKNKLIKPREKYKDELYEELEKKKKMSSKINEQFEKIQRLLARKDDKNDFIDEQTKSTNGNSNSTHKNTELLSKMRLERLERLVDGKKNKYYKSMCKTLMIEDILTYSSNVFENAKKLTEEHIVVSEKHQNSKKALKMVLDNVEHWKCRYGLYFDESYDGYAKIEIRKLVVSTLNLLISNGYMSYWYSMGQSLTKNAKIWMTPAPDPSAVVLFNVNFPFDSKTNTDDDRKNDGFNSLKAHTMIQGDIGNLFEEIPSQERSSKTIRQQLIRQY